MIARLIGPVILALVLWMVWRVFRPRVMSWAKREEMKNIRDLNDLAEEADGVSRKGKGEKLGKQVAKDVAKVKAASDAAVEAGKAL